MAITLDNLKRMVFPGESGGDYNALFGYANRDGGQFANTRLTDMTVDQALAFANPSGPYGQSVKKQIGRVATPMGAYQVVGTTLGAAKKGLGLTGSELMTPELQDRIGMWIYNNQGPAAWVGWGKGGGAATLSTKGTATMTPEQQPTGLLGALGTDKRDRFGNVMDALALGFSGMSMHPNQAIVQMAAGRMAERKQAKMDNRTAEMLQRMGAPAQLIELAKAGYGKEALGMLTAKTDKTALMQNYEYALKMGMSPDEARKWVSSGTSVNVDLGDKGATKFAEEFAKGDAQALSDVWTAGSSAKRQLNAVDRLEALLSQTPQGAEGWFKQVLGEFGMATEGLDNIQAAQALINNLVPQQRPPGSGPMSDADLELFKASLPRIISQPNGNALILQTIRGIAQYDAMGADIIQRMRAGEIDQSTAFRELLNRPDPLAGVNSLMNMGGAAAPSGTTGGVGWRIVQ